MPTIFDYIATMDAAPVDNPTGDGFGILPVLVGTGTAAGYHPAWGDATLPAVLV